MSGTPKTSVSHPLQLATVNVGGGRIGVTFAPGKTDPAASWATGIGTLRLVWIP